MRSQQIGLILRLMGPPIELLCALVYVWFRFQSQNRWFLGWPVENWCFVGIGIGLAVWITGWILLIRKPTRTAAHIPEPMDTERD